MDKLDPIHLWNLWYHRVYHKYCETQHRWVIREREICFCCDPSKPKCFVVGGKRNVRVWTEATEDETHD